MVWYALKAFFVFALLDRLALPVTRLAEYLRAVPVYREWNEAFLHRSMTALATTLLDELKRSGAITTTDGTIRPA